MNGVIGVKGGRREVVRGEIVMKKLDVRADNIS
jgi:hypothetical protein